MILNASIKVTSILTRSEPYELLSGKISSSTLKRLCRFYYEATIEVVFVYNKVEFMFRLPARADVVEICVAEGFQKAVVLSITKPKLFELSMLERILMPICDGWCQKTSQQIAAKMR